MVEQIDCKFAQSVTNDVVCSKIAARISRNRSSYLSPRFAAMISSQTAVLHPAVLQPDKAARAGESSRRRIPSRSLWLSLALLAALLLMLYAGIGVKLVSDWINYPDYSHGLLIPFFALFLLWDRREQLAAVPFRPSWAGLPLVGVGLFLMLLGVFGADLFLSRISFIVLVAGMVWMLRGRALMAQLGFVFFILLLSIPLPTLVMNHITFPLQLLASRVASAMLPLAGVPVLREGNIIQLPALPLEVAEACSGIRSLMSLFTVAVIMGYFVEQTMLRRTLLALASLPIAVAANVARIFGTGLCVQYWNPDKAVGFFHEFSGWLMFLVSLSLLYGVHLMMRWLPERRETA
jgi:exosortase